MEMMNQKYVSSFRQGPFSKHNILSITLMLLIITTLCLSTTIGAELLMNNTNIANDDDVTVTNSLWVYGSPSFNITIANIPPIHHTKTLTLSLSNLSLQLETLMILESINMLTIEQTFNGQVEESVIMFAAEPTTFLSYPGQLSYSFTLPPSKTDPTLVPTSIKTKFTLILFLGVNARPKTLEYNVQMVTNENETIVQKIINSNPQPQLSSVFRFLQFTCPDGDDITPPLVTHCDFSIKFTSITHALDTPYILQSTTAISLYRHYHGPEPNIFVPKDRTLPLLDSFKCSIINTETSTPIGDIIAQLDHHPVLGEALMFPFGPTPSLPQGISIAISCPGLEVSPYLGSITGELLTWTFSPYEFPQEITDVELPIQLRTTRAMYDFEPVGKALPIKTQGYPNFGDELSYSIEFPIFDDQQGNTDKPIMEWVIYSLGGFNLKFFQTVTYLSYESVLDFGEGRFYKKRIPPPALILDPVFTSMLKPALPFFHTFWSNGDDEAVPEWPLSEVKRAMITITLKADDLSLANMSFSVEYLISPHHTPNLAYKPPSSSPPPIVPLDNLGRFNVELFQSPPPLGDVTKKEKYTYSFRMSINNKLELNSPYISTINGTQSRGLDQGFRYRSVIPPGADPTKEKDCILQNDPFQMPWGAPMSLTIPTTIDPEYGLVFLFSDEIKMEKDYWGSITCPGVEFYVPVDPTDKQEFYKNRVENSIGWSMTKYPRPSYDIQRDADLPEDALAFSLQVDPVVQKMYEIYQIQGSVVAMNSFTTQSYAEFTNILVDQRFVNKVWTIETLSLLGSHEIEVKGFNEQCEIKTIAVYKKASTNDDIDNDERDYHTNIINCSFNSVENLQPDPVFRLYGPLLKDMDLDWSPPENPSPYDGNNLIELRFAIRYDVKKPERTRTMVDLKLSPKVEVNPSTEIRAPLFRAFTLSQYQSSVSATVVSISPCTNAPEGSTGLYDIDLIIAKGNSQVFNQDLILWVNNTASNLPDAISSPIIRNTAINDLDCHIDNWEGQEKISFTPTLLTNFGLLLPFKAHPLPPLDQDSSFTITCPGYVFNTLLPLTPQPPKNPFVKYAVGWILQPYFPSPDQAFAPPGTLLGIFDLNLSQSSSSALDPDEVETEFDFHPVVNMISHIMAHKFHLTLTLPVLDDADVASYIITSLSFGQMFCHTQPTASRQYIKHQAIVKRDGMEDIVVSLDGKLTNDASHCELKDVHFAFPVDPKVPLVPTIEFTIMMNMVTDTGSPIKFDISLLEATKKTIVWKFFDHQRTIPHFPSIIPEANGSLKYTLPSQSLGDLARKFTYNFRPDADVVPEAGQSVVIFLTADVLPSLDERFFLFTNESTAEQQQCIYTQKTPGEVEKPIMIQAVISTSTLNTVSFILPVDHSIRILQPATIDCTSSALYVEVKSKDSILYKEQIAYTTTFFTSPEATLFSLASLPAELPPISFTLADAFSSAQPEEFDFKPFSGVLNIPTMAHLYQYSLTQFPPLTNSMEINYILNSVTFYGMRCGTLKSSAIPIQINIQYEDGTEIPLNYQREFTTTAEAPNDCQLAIPHFPIKQSFDKAVKSISMKFVLVPDHIAVAPVNVKILIADQNNQGKAWSSNTAINSTPSLFSSNSQLTFTNPINANQKHFKLSLISTANSPIPTVGQGLKLFVSSSRINTAMGATGKFFNFVQATQTLSEKCKFTLGNSATVLDTKPELVNTDNGSILFTLPVTNAIVTGEKINIDCSSSTLVAVATASDPIIYSTPIPFAISYATKAQDIVFDSKTQPTVPQVGVIVAKAFNIDVEPKPVDFAFKPHLTASLAHYSNSIQLKYDYTPSTDVIEGEMKWVAEMKWTGVKFNFTNPQNQIFLTKQKCKKDSTESVFLPLQGTITPTNVKYTEVDQSVSFDVKIEYQKCKEGYTIDGREVEFNFAIDTLTTSDKPPTHHVTMYQVSTTSLNDHYRLLTPVLLSPSPLLTAEPIQMTYLNLTKAQFKGNEKVLRFIRLINPIEIHESLFSLNTNLVLASNATRILPPALLPFEEEKEGHQHVSFFEKIPGRKPLCDIINLKKKGAIYGHITPIQNTSNSTLTFDLTKNDKMQEIPVGASIAIQCQGWMVRAPHGGARTMPLSYTLTDITHDRAVSWVMEPMGYGSDDDKDDFKPKSHKALTAFIVILILALLGAGGYGAWYYFQKKKQHRDIPLLSIQDGSSSDYLNYDDNFL